MPIKSSVHIRKLTREEKAVLQSVADAQGIATAAGCVQYIMAEWPGKLNEIARLKRFLDMKQKKIERLQGEN